MRARLYAALWLVAILVAATSLNLAVNALEHDPTSNDTGEEYDGYEEEEDVTEVSSTPETTTRDFLEDIQPLFKELQRRLYPTISELLADPNLSNRCTGSILSLVRALQDQQKWALMIATASGGLPQNVLLGAQGSFGSYDQCLEAKRLSVDGEVNLRGQYCTLYVNPNKKLFNMVKRFMSDDPFFKDSLLKMKSWPTEILGIPTGMKVGVCTPDHCTQDDLNYVLNKLVNRVYGVKFEIGNCRVKHEKTPDTFQTCVIAFGFVLLLLVISGTATDYYLNRVRDQPIYISPWFIITFAMMFSARRNVLRLFTPYTPQSKELGFLNGIKVMLSCWVVYGHNAIFINPDVFLHISGYVRLVKKVSFQIVANGFMAVSSFFFISGFLLAYLCFKERKRIIRQNPVLLIAIMFVRRYFRLVTPLMVVVCFSMLMPLWTDSPNDQRSVFDIYARRCPTNWWSIPAVYANFMGADGMCLGHSWYVAVDLQVFVAAAILVLVILWKPTVGLVTTGLLALASCIWVAAKTYAYGFSPILGFTGHSPDTLIETFDSIYVHPLTHAGCYLFGVICAYVCLYHGKKLQWYTETVCWLLAHACTSYVVFITVVWYRYGMPGPFGEALYAGLHRLTFTIGLFWLIYACLHGMAPTMRRILEHSAFRALGRLAFGMYLIHFGVVYMQQGLMKSQAFHPDQYLLLQNTLGVLGISLGLAFLMNIAVESPVAHLDNFIFKKLMGRLIGEPQTHKEAEMIGRKAEVALTLEQHYDHWRRTSSKKSLRGIDDTARCFDIERGRSGLLQELSATQALVDSRATHNGDTVTGNGVHHPDIKSVANGHNSSKNHFDKTKL